MTLTTAQAIASIAVMAGVTFLTRYIPFLLFDSGKKQVPRIVLDVYKRQDQFSFAFQKIVVLSIAWAAGKGKMHIPQTGRSFRKISHIPPPARIG